MPKVSQRPLQMKEERNESPGGREDGFECRQELASPVRLYQIVCHRGNQANEELVFVAPSLSRL